MGILQEHKSTTSAGSQLVILRETWTHQSRVDKANGTLANRDALLVDAVEDGGPYGRRERGAADGAKLRAEDDEEVLADGRHVRVSATIQVEQGSWRDLGEVTVSSSQGVVAVAAEGPRCRRLLDILGHDVLLVVRGLEDVGEAAARAKLCGGDLVQLVIFSIGGSGVIELGRAHCQHIRAGGIDLRLEDLLVGAQAILLIADAIVTRRDDDCGTLQAQLHDLGALAFRVVAGHVIFAAAVRDGDDVCWLVDAALQCAAIAILVWIARILTRGVDTVACLAIGAEGAVAPVDSIVEV
jgi:hypothetical protein